MQQGVSQPTIRSWEIDRFVMPGRIGGFWRVCSGGCSVVRLSALIISFIGRRSHDRAPEIRFTEMVATTFMVIVLGPLVDVRILRVPFFLIGGMSCLGRRNSVIEDCLIVGAIGALSSLRDDEILRSSLAPLPIAFSTFLQLRTSLSSSSWSPYFRVSTKLFVKFPTAA